MLGLETRYSCLKQEDLEINHFHRTTKKLISAPLVWDRITDFAFRLHLKLIGLNLQHLKIISFPGVQNEDI